MEMRCVLAWFCLRGDVQLDYGQRKRLNKTSKEEFAQFHLSSSLEHCVSRRMRKPKLLTFCPVPFCWNP